MLFSEKMNLLERVSLFFSFSFSADCSHSSQVHNLSLVDAVFRNPCAPLHLMGVPCRHCHTLHDF